MKTRLLIAALSTVALAGCAQMQAQTGQCDVNASVSVVGDQRIEVTPEPIEVKEKNRWICWQLTDTSYTFTETSILIYDTDDEFENCKKGNEKGRLDNSRLVACKDKNNKHGQKPLRAYKYSITVQRANGSTIPKDPWIVND